MGTQHSTHSSDSQQVLWGKACQAMGMILYSSENVCADLDDTDRRNEWSFQKDQRLCDAAYW
jgi:hypothetical protein